MSKSYRKFRDQDDDYDNFLKEEKIRERQEKRKAKWETRRDEDDEDEN